MKKRGSFFFTLDVFIASIIITLTLVLIFNSYSTTEITEDNQQALSNYMFYLTQTEIADMNDIHIYEQIENKVIRRLDYRIYEQIAEFQYRGEHQLASNLAKNVTDDTLPPQFGMMYILNGTHIYNRSIDTYDTTTMVLVAHKITFFRINTTDIYELADTEVRIWV
jgi:hypothetical protein